MVDIKDNDLCLLPICLMTRFLFFFSVLVEVQVKNEQDEDYSRMEEEEGQEAAEMMHYTEYNDYDGAQNQASPYAGSRASSGKLNCDICGLACVSLNVLLVHKRSHTGKHWFLHNCP